MCQIYSGERRFLRRDENCHVCTFVHKKNSTRSSKNNITYSNPVYPNIPFSLCVCDGTSLLVNEEELFSFRRITLAPFLVMSGYGFVLFGIMKKQ